MSDLPTPITREERYLNGIAQGDTSNLPTPVGREEKYLDYIARNGGGGGGTTNYNALENKPQIAGTTLQGDKSLADLGIASAEALTNKVDKVEGKGLSTNDYSDTEKGKVADNTAAIEAIVNVTGACNLAPVGTTQTIRNRTFTVNSDGSVTVSGSGDGNSAECWVELSLKPGTYKMSGTPLTDPATFAMVILANNSQRVVSDVGGGVEFTITNENITHYLLVVTAAADLTTPKTFYPMIYDARLKPTGYVPYAMTNRELTERALAYIDIPIADQTVNSGSVYAFDLTTVPTGYRPISWSYSSDYDFSVGAFFTIDEKGEGGYRCYVYNPHSSNIGLRGHLKVACCKYY